MRTFSQYPVRIEWYIQQHSLLSLGAPVGDDRAGEGWPRSPLPPLDVRGERVLPTFFSTLPVSSSLDCTAQRTK